jgi:DNA repair exonuclease SbcCD ATPase subunit
MLQLKRLEVQGFGPFADPQVINFPTSPGVTVIYGENMRGKTSLLNAIRYAFFGTVLGRGSDLPAFFGPSVTSEKRLPRLLLIKSV